MTMRHVREPLITDWLRGTLDPIPDPAHLYPDILARIRETEQEPGSPPAAPTRRLWSWIPTTRSRANELTPGHGRTAAVIGTTHTSLGISRFAVAAVIVALFGGFLLVAQPFERAAVTVPGAETEGPVASRDMAPGLWQRAWVFHPEGELESGWHVAIVDGYPFGYWLPAGWSTGGPGDLGGYLTKDGVTVRMSSPRAVYSDPCEHTLGPSLGSSTDDLANALMAIPGTEASGPTDVPIALDYFDDWGIRTTAKHVVLTIPEDAPCGPGESGFYLWRTGDGKGVPWSGPRWVEALGSTINVWVWKQENRSNFPRILVDAETIGALSPEIEREIHEIFASIQFPGG